VRACLKKEASRGRVGPDYRGYLFRIWHAWPRLDSASDKQLFFPLLLLHILLELTLQSTADNRVLVRANG
jgi:hypothetical protein